MSGLSRTPGKRVRVNSPPRVRIPLSPPIPCFTGYFFGLFRLFPINGLFPALPNKRGMGIYQTRLNTPFQPQCAKTRIL